MQKMSQSKGIPLLWMESFLLITLTCLLAACGKMTPPVSKTAEPSATPASQAAKKPHTSPGPMETIHMLDTLHGWALTSNTLDGWIPTDTSVLKTSDGGLHWTDVTPPNLPVRTSASGAFRSQNEAWVVGMTRQEPSVVYLVEHTKDGGTHWQHSQFSDKDTGTNGVSSPHFLNRQEGWVDVREDFSMGAATITNAVFHTTDGGSHWSKLASYEQIHQNASVTGKDTGISVKDRQHIWNTINATDTANEQTPISPHPVAFVTHNGGKSWQEQILPSIDGLANVLYATTPPVFFGNDGLMPVYLRPGRGVDEPSKAFFGMSIYVTQDGGTHWSSGTPTTFADSSVYILDRHHIWAASGTSIHASQDGGKSWNTLGSIGKPYMHAMDISFTDLSNGWITTTIDTNGNGPQLLRTTDGGHTWQPIAYSIQ